MNKQIIVSAPGKLMLFGEHAVVHGKPCIVTAVGQRLELKAKKLKEKVFKLSAKDVDIINYHKPLKDLGKGEIPKGAKFVERALLNFSKSYPLKSGVEIETISQFKSTFGFGSSSASTVCTVKALCELFNINLSEKEIFDVCYKTVLDVQGVGSGFDLAAAIYGGTLYFLKGGILIEQLSISNLQLVVGYSGIKADTVTLIRQVNKLAEEQPGLVEGTYEKIEDVVKKAKKALEKKDFETVGKLMDQNQSQLRNLGVSIEKLDNMIDGAREAGAYGAKLSGAGGGDCMIALVEEKNRRAVERSIEKAGGQVLKVELNAVGVRAERLVN